MTYVLVWINGFLFGALACAVYLWVCLVTGRRTVRGLAHDDEVGVADARSPS